MKKPDRQKRNATISNLDQQRDICRKHSLFPDQYDIGEKDDICWSRPLRISFSQLCSLIIIFIMSLSGPSFAATRYVWTNSPSPGSGYQTWSTAAHTIQEAIDVSVSNDVIWVTNGIYSTGARVGAGISNRVVVPLAVTLVSVNGPDVTIIRGAGVLGSNAMRCVYLTTNAVVSGFTLTQGATMSEYNSTGYGGGIYCADQASIVTNCVLYGNTAANGAGGYRGKYYNCRFSDNTSVVGSAVYYATAHYSIMSLNYCAGASYSTLYNCNISSNSYGGAQDSTLYNCTLSGNTANGGGGSLRCTMYYCRLIGNQSSSYGGGAYYGLLYGCYLFGNTASNNLGGGAYQSTLHNCTVNGNIAYDGGGVYGSQCYNSIVYGNQGLRSANYDISSVLNSSCSWPLPPGPGNFTNAPGWISPMNPHLLPGASCINRGNNTYPNSPADVDGEPRTNGIAVDVGCDEFWPGLATGAMSATINIAPMTQATVGYPLTFQAYIDGRPNALIWDFGDGAKATNQGTVTHAYSSVGDFAVVLRATNMSDGASATTSVHIINMSNATRYAAASGSDVSDGTSWTTAKATIQAAISAVPAAGGLVWVSNGVYASGGVLVAGTMTRAALSNGMTIRSMNGPSVTTIQGLGPAAAAVRCAFVGDGSCLSGFTLTNGCAATASYGGGVYCDSAAGIISNCILTGNEAVFGAGAFQGSLYNCMFLGNRAGNDDSPFNGKGGGAYNGELYNCTIADNSAGNQGGGVYGGSLINCLLLNNWADDGFGGGSYNSMLTGCLLNGNQAGDGLYTGEGGGAYGGTLSMCVLSSNSAASGGGANNSVLTNCTMMGNRASGGAGANQGSLYNCAVLNNLAYYGGGGVSAAILYNCTVIGNGVLYDYSSMNLSVSSGGGVEGCKVFNSIVYYNAAGDGANYSGGEFYSSCSWPLPPGPGNFTNAPGLAATNNPHLVVDSPCIDMGSIAYSTGALDVDGDPRTNGAVIDIGCDEFWTTTAKGDMLTAVEVMPGTNTTVGYPLTFLVSVEGRPISFVLSLGDGAAVSNQLLVTHAYAAAGVYPVVIRATNLSGVVASTVTVHAVNQAGATRFVATNGNDAWDGLSWVTAKATIQSAISITPPCGLVLVSNGVYATGTNVIRDSLNNVLFAGRIIITNGVRVKSVNGPALTSIVGQGPVGSTDAASCAYVGDGSMLVGFTLTNGCTQNNLVGGGVLCHSTAGQISNTVIVSCLASRGGGGAYRGTLVDCLFEGNLSVFGGAAYGCTLYNCTLTNNHAMKGGGAFISTLHDCIIEYNAADLVGSFVYDISGGGASHSLLLDSRVSGNSAVYAGGGTSDSTIIGCLVEENVASNGGGAYSSSIQNCMVTNNYARESGGGAYWCSIYNSQLTRNAAAINGGGSYDSFMQNCTVSDNSTSNEGGGAFHGTIMDSTLSGNSAGLNGGGVCGANVGRSVLTNNYAPTGGGSAYSILTNCTIVCNQADNGGGDAVGDLFSCLLYGNRAGSAGGGGYLSDLYNCTLAGNAATNYGGGAYICSIYNGIVYYNTCSNGANHFDSSATYSCTVPNTGGTGNTTNTPQFVDAAVGNYRLSTNSPCIDRGNNVYVQGTTDLGGNPRFLNGVVDMGAYETQLYTGYRAWAAAITNGLTNDTDCATGDGYPNLLKYATGSSPTDADDLPYLRGWWSNGWFQAGFHRNTNAVDVTIFVEDAYAITNKAPWNGLVTNKSGSWSGATNVSESGASSPLSVTVQVADPVGKYTNRFLRLRVTRP